MNLILLILFVIVGIAGLFYNVDTGVFIGLGLIPWQILKIKLKRKFVLTAIVISSAAGLIYFIYYSKWLIAALFVFIQLYNYWGYLNISNE